jgi:quinol monooxygenase YgiN
MGHAPERAHKITASGRRLHAYRSAVLARRPAQRKATPDFGTSDIATTGQVEDLTEVERPGWRLYDRLVIFISAKFRVLPDHADDWADITREFTNATRAESGNLWFDWSRSLDDPTEYVLVEAFRDGEAGSAHVQSDHFKAAIAALPQYLVETPRIISQTIDQDDWSELGEMKVG